jgi:hypothetical protein
MVPEIVTRVIALAGVNELAKNTGVNIAIIARFIMREKILLPGCSFSVMLHPMNTGGTTSTLCGHLLGHSSLKLYRP